MDARNLRSLQTDPKAFREAILIDSDSGPVRLGSVLDPWQRADFEALDPAWQRVCGNVPGILTQIQRGYLERPRGHSKTSDIAVSVTWALFASKRKLSGVVAAADADQARLIRDAIDKLLRLNPWLGTVLTVGRGRIENKHTGSDLVVLSSDAASSYGLTPDFVICDEITHWQKRDMWDSLLSATAKRRACLLLVIANAGFSESWQWSTREAIRNDPAWYFHRLEGPQASWILPAHLEEQKRLLPSKVYRRLWLNEWSQGAGDALESADIDASVTLQGELHEPERGWAYAAGLDIGLKRDATALIVIGKHCGYVEKVLTHKPTEPLQNRVLADLGMIKPPKSAKAEYRRHEGTGRLKLAAVRVWRPQGGRVELEQIESEIVRLNDRFLLSSVAFDPWQAEYLAQRLEAQRITTEPVNFVPTSLQEMATATLDAFRERQIELYDHPALLADLRALRVAEKSYGYRLESPRQSSGDGTHHGDTATALAIALKACRQIQLPRCTIAERKLVLYP